VQRSPNSPKTGTNFDWRRKRAILTEPLRHTTTRAHYYSDYCAVGRHAFAAPKKSSLPQGKIERSSKLVVRATGTQA